jgi:D-alanyl-D-alanine carboxypeptidase
MKHEMSGKFCAMAAIVMGVWTSPLSAGPAVLFDASTQMVLYAEDYDDLWHPASLTKIMTAYVTFEAIKEGAVSLQSVISCSSLASNQGPMKVGLRVGEKMTVEAAVQALIVKSANDVAVALAEAIAPSHEAFVERMNATAARLGMTHTKFVNANGLPATDQVTTARDMAKLASAVVRDYPQYAHFWSMLEAQVGKHRLHTHNGILTNYAGADGMKTGFICNSGFNVVASATRDGHKLIAVVLGEATGAERTVRTANLLEHGFQVHEWKSMFSSHTVESLPTAENIKTTVTIPQKVISWVCGTGRAIPKTKKDQVATGRQRDQKASALSKRTAVAKKDSSPWPTW